MREGSLSTRVILPALSLAWREVKHFLRQRGRVMGALGTPILFWLFIGAGIGSSFSPEALAGSDDYLEYFFPGTLALILLFTSIFSMISLIKERNEGFLQGVLVAPVSRFSIVLGKVLGCTVLALLQGSLFLLLAPFIGIPLDVTQVFLLVGVMALISFELSSIGFLFAWKSESIQSFHAVMNMVLFPMWLLSGALFPAGGASPWLGWVLAINPLTYGVSALRHAMRDPAGSVVVPLLVTAVSALGMFLVASVLVRRSARGGEGLV